jgi:hypothetical protein
MAQAIEYLPSKHEALSSNLSTTQKKELCFRIHLYLWTQVSVVQSSLHTHGFQLCGLNLLQMELFETIHLY